MVEEKRIKSSLLKILIWKHVLDIQEEMLRMELDM